MKKSFRMSVLLAWLVEERRDLPKHPFVVLVDVGNLLMREKVNVDQARLPGTSERSQGNIMRTSVGARCAASALYITAGEQGTL